MTWFAVPDDLVGGWAVANRQAPMSELNLWDCECGHEMYRDHASTGQCVYGHCICRQRTPVDVVICDSCKSQEDARRIAALLNLHDAPTTSRLWAADIIDNYSAPWPEAKEEA